MTAILVGLVILLVGAILSVALAAAPRASLLVAMLSIGAASIFCFAAAIPQLLHGQDHAGAVLNWPLPLGVARLALDGLAAWFLASLAILSFSVAIYAWAYLQSEIGQGSVPALGAFLCLLVAALILVITAADVLLFLVGWEMMMLASFFLVAFHHRDPEVRRSAWMYLVVTHLGTGLFLVPMFGALVARAGSTEFSAFRGALQPAGQSSCVVLFLLGLLGFGTKAGLMPMHIWLPVAHPAAPTPVSAFMSGIVIKTGIYGLMRLLSWLPELPSGCAMLMLAIGMVSGVLGVLYAVAQHEIKRLLAYHSVENIGIIALGLGMGMFGQRYGHPELVALGYGGALLHVLNHALFKGLLFLSAGTVIHATGTGDLERLGGLAQKTPFNAALFLIAAISICGLPPLNGFVSEWILYGSLFGGALGASRASAGVAALGAMSLALMGGLALACFAKVFSVIFLGEARNESVHSHSTPHSMRVGMIILAAFCVGIGVLPGVVVPLLSGGVNAVAHVPAQEFDACIRVILAPVSRLSALAAVLLGIIVLLAVGRRLALRRNVTRPVPAVATWGCGYSRPAARMQYTASSFGWSLLQSFRHLLWPHREFVAPAGVFAGHAHMESETPDLAEQDFFAPLFRGIDRLFQMIRTLSWSGEAMPETAKAEHAGRVGPLRVFVGSVVSGVRRGSIHVYLSFIVLTLLVIFFIEALSMPNPGPFSPPVAPRLGTVNGVLK